ncbi:Sua5 family C-terminal domain-containing protein, partial [Halobacillus sp. BBL2006]|uniref:Sua5 family C-terminal domain-containing protein n=1 Tax=Halobacillus sp. BBL2006 TaxID=1543706 RepID=UPI0005442D5A
WLVEGSDGFFKEQLHQLAEEGQRVGVIASKELANQLDHERVIACGSRDRLNEVAGRLYAALREFKKADVDVILCESFKETGVGAAIMNRLTKASVKILKQG